MPTGGGLLPCAYDGVFTVFPAWAQGNSLLAITTGAQLDVPLALTHIHSFEEVHSVLYPQFIALCHDNHNFTAAETAFNYHHTSLGPVETAGFWEPVACAEDMMRQVREWIEVRCRKQEGEESAVSSASSSASSLRSFKMRIQRILNLESPAWSIADLDQHFLPGAVRMTASNNNDGCDGIIATAESPLRQKDIRVDLIGDIITNAFARRQRDYIVRDLLGCLPHRVRICIDTSIFRGGKFDEVAECTSMLLHYDEHGAQGPPSAKWWCGRCDDNERDGINDSGVAATAVAVVVILVTAANDDESVSRDTELARLWSPVVVIHLNDEAGVSPSVLLGGLYRGASLVLRNYRHAELQAALSERGARRRRGVLPEVWTIPLGWGTGFLDSLSGTEAARRAAAAAAAAARSPLATPAPRPARWAFVGSRGVHLAYVTDARAAMSSFMTGTAGSNYSCHISNRDGYIAPHDIHTRFYQYAEYVASPRGESLDCFRHWEAVVSGAIPIVDQPPEHPAWSWWGVPPIASLQNSLSSLFPLGFLFPSHDGEGAESEEAALQALEDPKEDPALSSFEHEHSPRGSFGRASHVAEWPGVFCKASVWKELARRLDVIGPEETELRRQLNARAYIAYIDDVRRAVHVAIMRRLHERREEKEEESSASSYWENSSSGDEENTKPIATTNDDNNEDANEEVEVEVEKIRHKTMDIAVHNGAQLQAAVRDVRTLVLSASSSPAPYSIGATIHLCSSNDVWKLSSTLEISGPNLTLMLLPASPNSPNCTALQNFATPLEKRTYRGRRARNLLLSDALDRTDVHVTLDAQRRGRALRVVNGAHLIIKAVLTVTNGRVVGSCRNCSDAATSDTGHGAGILVDGAGTLLEASELILRHNDCQRYGGGGMFVSNNARALLRSPRFEQNFAASYGGGLGLRGAGSSVEVRGRARFTENRAYRGGAVACFEGARFMVGDAESWLSETADLRQIALFDGNLASWNGGAIFIDSGSTSSVHTAVFQNNAVSSGGAIAHIGHDSVLLLGRFLDLSRNTAALGNALFATAAEEASKSQFSRSGKVLVSVVGGGGNATCLSFREHSDRPTACRSSVSYP